MESYSVDQCAVGMGPTPMPNPLLAQAAMVAVTSVSSLVVLTVAVKKIAAIRAAQ